MDRAIIKTEVVFRNFVRRQLLVTWGFLALCFGLLSLRHTNLSSSQFIRTVKTTGCQWITLEWWIVRMPQGDRAVIYRFGERGKTADGWKLATICYTRIRKTFPSVRGGGRRGRSSDLLRVGAWESSASATDTNNTSFATRSTTKRTNEKMGIKSNIKETTHKTKPQEKIPVNFLF